MKQKKKSVVSAHKLLVYLNKLIAPGCSCKCPLLFKKKKALLVVWPNAVTSSFRSLKLEFVENPFHVLDFQNMSLDCVHIYRKLGLYMSRTLSQTSSLCVNFGVCVNKI